MKKYLLFIALSYAVLSCANAELGVFNFPEIHSGYEIVIPHDSNSENLTSLPPVEDCTDGIDNDGDGLIDCEDPDCSSFDNDGDGVCDSIDLDDDNDGLLDSEECILFDPTCSVDALDSDFELTDLTSIDGTADDQVSASGIIKVDASFVDNWNSLASDNLIEIWDNTQTAVPAVSAYSGDQWLELNATVLGGVYQDICTTPDTDLNWSVAHHGRIGTDVMRVLIGDASGTLQSQGDYSATDVDGWQVHSGTYTIPAGQISTRITLEAISSGSGSTSSGNFIDLLELASSFPNAINLCDTDSDGTPDHLDLDSDNDGIYDVVEAGGISSDPDLNGIIGNGASSAIADTDNDGWSNIVDSDNGGVAMTDFDSDSDGIPDRIEIDSDNDGCKDVTEAGFPDADGDGQLGGLVPPSVDPSGKVTSGGL